MCKYVVKIKNIAPNIHIPALDTPPPFQGSKWDPNGSDKERAEMKLENEQSGQSDSFREKMRTTGHPFLPTSK